MKSLSGHGTRMEPDKPSELLPHEIFGDGVAPTAARERILEHAQDLFYSMGFHDVALDTVLTSAKVTKTTFYRHFESRDALILETIKRADAQVYGSFMEQVRARAGWDARAALLAMFDVMHDWFNGPKFRGCLFLAACISFPNARDPIHEAAAAHYLVTANDVEQMAQALGIEQARDFAEKWVLLIEGAVSRRLLSGAGDSARIAGEMAKELLAEYLP